MKGNGHGKNFGLDRGKVGWKHKKFLTLFFRLYILNLNIIENCKIMTQTCYKTWTDAESRVMLGTGSGQRVTSLQSCTVENRFE